MTVIIKEVSEKSDLKAFIKLPYEIYKHIPQWIPPLLKEEKAYWTQHPGQKKNKVKLFLALKNGKPAGRIAYMVNQRYNELNNTKNARFFGLEAIDEPEVFNTLFARAEEEARADGMTHIHGPLGYNNLDHQGLLVEGFDRPQAVVSVYHPPYYKEHLERLGYTKEMDWVEMRVTITDEPVKKGKRGAAIIKRRFGIEAWQPRTKQELVEAAEDIFEIYNQGFKQLHYMVPLDEEDMKFYKKSYLDVLLPQWSFFAIDTKNNHKKIGMMLAMPSLGDALRKAKGKLFPFGLFHLIKALRKPKELDIGIIATLPEYANQGAAAVIFDRLHDVMLQNNIKVFETGGMFETNANALSNWKNYEHEQHKRKRVYGKSLER